jgi:hypothetical protein
MVAAHVNVKSLGETQNRATIADNCLLAPSPLIAGNQCHPLGHFPESPFHVLKLQVWRRFIRRVSTNKEGDPGLGTNQRRQESLFTG